MSSPRSLKDTRTGLDRFLERSLKNWIARQAPPPDERDRLLAAAEEISVGRGGWRAWSLIWRRIAKAGLRGYSNMPNDMFSHALANSRSLHPLWVLLT